ncbi:MAG: PDZ domain-containing protein [Pirellulaceae bacterium]
MKEPAGNRAWLGVMLVPAKDDGVVIQSVARQSPASQAGLRPGDKIVKHGDIDVSDPESFIDSVLDKGPGSEMRLTIDRSGESQQISVVLGNMSNAPMSFMRDAMSGMRDGQRAGNRWNFGGGSDDMVDDVLNEMRSRIRELEKKVEELSSKQNGNAKPVDDDAGILCRTI